MLTSCCRIYHHVLLRTAVTCCLAASSALAAHTQQPVPGIVNPAIIPKDRLNEPWWAARHRAILESIRSQPDTQLLMIGDSITNNYDKLNPPDENFQPIWNEFYATRKALNLGYSADTTANLLWRLDHGEVDGIKPKVAVLLIGTNNTGHADQTAEETEGGVDTVVGDLEQRLPQTHILLIGVLPSEISTSKTKRDQAVNAHLAACYSEDPRVAYLDIGSIFFKDGVLNTAIFYDPRLPEHRKSLHPDTIGQRRMAEAIEPTLARLMSDVPRVPLASMTDINTALIPVPYLELDSYDWYARHHAELELEKKVKPGVVLIGDSITHFWGGEPLGNHQNGPTAWQQIFGNLPAINMGFGWDRTQNVLWRLRQGEFEGVSPAWVVLAIGTNNLTGTTNARASTPEEIVEAIAAIRDEIHQRSPQSHIVLMAIFPRGAQSDAPLRAPIQETNRLLAKRFSDDQTVTFLDIGQQFLTSDGSLPVAMMPDGTHPSDAGYKLWADALIKTGIKP
jgi:lysophospholipase L1-like esterase